MLFQLGLRQPANGIARKLDEAEAIVQQIGYPVLVRPSFVLGGRAMEICYDDQQFQKFVAAAFVVSQGQPVLIDQFLEDAIEVDVDCIADGQVAIIAGVMEHIEEAGVHSGDSACSIPPYSLPALVIDEIRAATKRLALELRVKGMMNVQYAIKNVDGVPTLYVLEVNPRASRTVPFVAKACGVPVAKIATKVMAGVSLQEQGVGDIPTPRQVSVKESVFPFRKFAGVDIVLGPEMKSTGEVMGTSDRFSIAFAKSQLAAGVLLPTSGTIFLSVSSRHKIRIVPVAQKLHALGFKLLATTGTATALEAADIPVTRIKKLAEGQPNLIDYLKNGEVDLIINTPMGKGGRTDEGKIRASAVQLGVSCITTIQAAEAAVLAMESEPELQLEVLALQDRFPKR